MLFMHSMSSSNNNKTGKPDYLADSDFRLDIFQCISFHLLKQVQTSILSALFVTFYKRESNRDCEVE